MTSGFGVGPFGSTPFGGSGKTPASIPGLLRWGRADDAASIGDGGIVTSLPDRVSGRWLGRGGTDGPTYRATAFGGRPALEFTGVTAKSLISDGTTNFPSTGYTVWAVARRTVLGGASAVLVAADPVSGAATRVTLLGYASATQGRFVTFTTAGDTRVDTSDTNIGDTRGVDMALTGTVSGDVAELWRNGSSDGPAVLAGGIAAGLRRVTVGDTERTDPLYLFTGLIAEWGVYDHALDAAERAVLHAYIRDHHGLLLDDVPHPPPVDNRYFDDFRHGAAPGQIDKSGAGWDALSSLTFSADGLGRAEYAGTNAGLAGAGYLATNDVSGNMEVSARYWKRGAATSNIGIFRTVGNMLDGYTVRMASDGQLALYEWGPTGTGTSRLSSTSAPGLVYVDGDRIGLRRIGSRLYVLRNGVVVGTWTDTAPAPYGSAALIRAAGGTGGGGQFAEFEALTNLPSPQTVASIADTFDRASTVLTDGQGADWDAAPGAWRINPNGTVSRTATSAASAAPSTRELHSADHEVWMSIPVIGASNAQIIARYTGPHNNHATPSGYYAQVTSAGAIQLGRVDAGVVTSLATASPGGTLVAGGRLGIRVVGNQLTLLYDNGAGVVEHVTRTDNTYRTSRRVAFRAWGNTGVQHELDNFTATSLGAEGASIIRESHIDLKLTTTAVGAMVLNLIALTARIGLGLVPTAAATKVSSAFARVHLSVAPRASARQVLIRRAAAVLGLSSEAFGTELDITRGRVRLSVGPRATYSVVRSATARIRVDIAPTARAHAVLSRAAVIAMSVAARAPWLRLQSREGRISVLATLGAVAQTGATWRDVTILSVGEPTSEQRVDASAPAGRAVVAAEPRS